MGKKKSRSTPSAKKARSIYTQHIPPKPEEVKVAARAEVTIGTVEPELETFDIDLPEYDSEEVVKQFKGYVAGYRDEFMGMILKHQAARTAISQIVEITTKEFGAPFVEFDEEFDDGIADTFKLMFFRNLITGLNKHLHSDAPIDVEAVIRLLFFNDPKEPENTKSSPSVNKLRKDLAALAESFRKTPPTTGPYGVKGERNDKSTR